MNIVLLVTCVSTCVSANICYLDEGLGLTNDGNFRHETTRKQGRGDALTTWDCQTISPVPEDVRADMSLDDFYQKYTHAYGVPIISSQNPSDDALVRACYVVRFMLADRKDVRDAMYDSYGRVGVIGITEQTTDIPEHSYLPDYYNTRARGLGGIPSRPISTDAEENLLCKSGRIDRWYEEDILVHEFAHAVHLISMRRVDTSFKERLLAAHLKAEAEGLWKHTYAIYNDKEYFAEGVQSYFDVEVNRTFTDYVHNDIATRAALYDYDRPLYDLIEEVFPCRNVIIDRCNSDQDLAATQQLQMDCILG